MGTPTGLVSRAEAARLLHVNVDTVTRMAHQGLLKQTIRKRKTYYTKTEVVAISQVFNGKRDYTAIANLALRAYFKADAAEKKLAEMAELFGLDLQALDTDEEAVLIFHEEVRRRLKERAPIAASEVMILAKKLYAITEEYLKLVERYACDDEPWRPYLELTQYLGMNIPKKHLAIDQELSIAYGYMEAARRHLRPVAFFYVQAKDGRKAAKAAFLGTHFTDDLIATLYPH